MEVKVNALVIKAVDYKDNDRILTLYSLEKGKITAGIKGVKKAGAKLKFASEPFCFAEYILAEKNGRYTVTSASYFDSFYDLRLNLNKYYLSAVVSEFLNAYTETEMADPTLFDVALNAIKNICYQDNEFAHLANFLLSAINGLGYAIENPSCAFCSSIINGRVFFRYKDATFACEECREEDYSEIREETYNAFVSVFNDNLDGLKEKQEGVKMLIYFLSHYLSIKTDIRLKSIESLKNLQ
ncbi:MAG: DNA repair protein RecO [Clostridia bacterium]|nr:DNA repair protein RecO [Clostridia bacterium]